MVSFRPAQARLAADGAPAGGSIDGKTAPRSRQPAKRAPLFISIPAILVSILLLIPVCYLVIRASGAGTEAIDLLTRPRTLEILRNTIVLAAAVVGASIVIAVPLAWLVGRTDLPGRILWSSTAALPLVVPSYVGAMTIVAALGPRGLLQDALSGPFGVERLPSIYGFTGAWIALTLFSYPYVYLNVRAALRGLDPAHEEAARCLGHGPWRTFFLTTLPQLRPAIVAGALLTALYTISDFGVVTLLRYDAFTRAIYVQYRSSFDRTLAAVLALVLIALALVLVVSESWFRGRAVYHRIGAGSARRSRPLPLGRWRWPSFIYCAVVFGLSIGLPIGVLVYWLIRGLDRGDRAEGMFAAARHSVSISAMAAVVATVAAFPVAVLAVRYRGWVGRTTERICYLGYGLPGIVIALSFVFIGARYLTTFYQTLPLMVTAYVVRFLPQALGAERSSLLQVSPKLEEAARTLGRSSFGAIRAVTAPLSRPGIAAGGALVFLTVMKELPITLLLSPTGYKTLATSVWTSTGSGNYGQAAIPALILVGLSSIPTLWLSLRERTSIPRQES